jgi:RimJ/RimL family protein N-acetyltransferase
VKPALISADTAIETERLTIRLVERSDLSALLIVNGNDAVTRFLPYPSWTGMADAQAWFDRMAARFETGAAAQFVIVHRERGHVMGSCLLFHFDEPSARAEVGYVLGREHWGAGYMHEAMTALVAFAFGTLGLRRLEAEIDPRNAASAKLLERLGFVKEGLLRQRWATKNEVTDSGLYGLLRSDGSEADANGVNL